MKNSSKVDNNIIVVKNDVLNNLILNNPKNKRRSRNKIITEDDCFELVYDMSKMGVKLNKKKDTLYSSIPYDTCRKYIEAATYLYLNKPDELDSLIDKHESNIEKYISLSLSQVGIPFNQNRIQVKSELKKIRDDKYFKIQIAGRMLQHDETGPLSASLPNKFLYEYNSGTGIYNYIEDLIDFFEQKFDQLPVKIENNSLYLLGESTNSRETKESFQDIYLSPNIVVKSTKKSLVTEYQKLEKSDRRKNYRAHSVDPRELEQYFDDVHDNFTNNKINVVSDIHAADGTIDLISPNFNIIAGDLSNNMLANNSDLKGIAVIGNWDIIACEKEVKGLLSLIQKILNYPKPSDRALYRECKRILEKSYSGLIFLNNECYIYEGVRYVGLSIPLCYVKSRVKIQENLSYILEQLLGVDKEIPTVIVSHAPLFNELSFLSPESQAYEKKHVCVNDKIKELFSEYNIVGAIHGHHHIPASSGVIKYKEFAGKNLFVCCSCYSNSHNGFDLQAEYDKLLNKSIEINVNL